MAKSDDAAAKSDVAEEQIRLMTSYEWLLRLGMEKYADAFEDEGCRCPRAPVSVGEGGGQGGTGALTGGGRGNAGRRLGGLGQGEAEGVWVSERAGAAAAVGGIAHPMCAGPSRWTEHDGGGERGLPRCSAASISRASHGGVAAQVIEMKESEATLTRGFQRPDRRSLRAECLAAFPDQASRPSPTTAFSPLLLHSLHPFVVPHPRLPQPGADGEAGRRQRRRGNCQSCSPTSGGTAASATSSWPGALDSGSKEEAGSEEVLEVAEERKMGRMPGQRE